MTRSWHTVAPFVSFANFMRSSTSQPLSFLRKREASYVYCRRFHISVSQWTLSAAEMRRLGIATHSWIGSKTLRCREALILPEESLYVLGTALEHHGMSHHIANESRLYIGSSRDHAFIISDRSEKHLLSRLTWQMWAGFLGGLALIAGCAAMILDQT